MQAHRALFIPLLILALGHAQAAPAGKQQAWRQALPAPIADTDYVRDGVADPAKVALGQQLFFDKILSGNFNISCATCHHPLADTGDGLSLPIGEGGRGLGVTRDTGSGDSAVPERVPRNAPPVFNLGAREFTVLFHDGRIQPNPAFPGGIESPAGMALPDGLDSVLAAQAMFPVTSGTEMAGQAGENPIADAAADGNLAGPDGVWAQLAERLAGIHTYVSQFVAVYDDIDTAGDIEFRHAANAIAAFEAARWRADNSPFDRYLRGDRGALSLRQLKGMRIFYSARKGNCAECHSGKFQTDHSFRAIGMPQIGAGKGDGDSGYEDFGRERVTGQPADRYRFRVPSLRNVVLTTPYGHSGAFDNLEGIIQHHLDPAASLATYDRTQARFPSRPDLDAQDFQAMDDAVVRNAIANASELGPSSLSDTEIELLVEFLHALTDPAMLDLHNDVPTGVPSGLPLAE